MSDPLDNKTKFDDNPSARYLRSSGERRVTS